MKALTTLARTLSLAGLAISLPAMALVNPVMTPHGWCFNVKHLSGPYAMTGAGDPRLRVFNDQGRDWIVCDGCYLGKCGMKAWPGNILPSPTLLNPGIRCIRYPDGASVLGEND